MLWVGLGLIVLGLMAAWAGQSGVNIRNFRGNFAQRVNGNVNQTYTEVAGAAKSEVADSSNSPIVTWGGLAVAFAGLIVSILQLIKG